MERFYEPESIKHRPSVALVPDPGASRHQYLKEDALALGNIFVLTKLRISMDLMVMNTVLAKVMKEKADS